MPDCISHLNQAKHNQACAQHLLQRSTWRDWAITAAFYAAVHFTQAAFLAENEPMPIRVDDGESQHAIQLKHVRKLFGDNSYRYYDKLSKASDRVRYLRRYNGADDIPSISYYTPEDARRFVTQDLENLFKEIDNRTSVNLR